MPVLVNRGALGYRLFSPTEHLRARPEPEFREGDANCIELGLVNNMPDSALEQTERQVLKLLDAAAPDGMVVRLSLFSLSKVPRTPLGQQHLSRLSYLSICNLQHSNLDGVIITGAEPRTTDLTEEAYWSELTDVFDWAADSSTSTVCSCLAVHAAVLHLDGIRRQALDEKCFGIFEFTKREDHPIMNSVPQRIGIPHSRLNAIGADDLVACGYAVLTSSEQAGVDTFVKMGKNLFVFFQGHPEYEAWTLFSEFRRDVERFVRHERDTYPNIPQGCLDEDTARDLNEFRERAYCNRRKEVLAHFPYAAVVRKLTDPWRPVAGQIYRNWLLHMSAKKAEKARQMRGAELV
jgi:homoserine O-succinyltransferase